LTLNDLWLLLLLLLLLFTPSAAPSCTVQSTLPVAFQRTNTHVRIGAYRHNAHRRASIARSFDRAAVIGSIRCACGDVPHHFTAVEIRSFEGLSQG